MTGRVFRLFTKDKQLSWGSTKHNNQHATCDNILHTKKGPVEFKIYGRFSFYLINSVLQDFMKSASTLINHTRWFILKPEETTYLFEKSEMFKCRKRFLTRVLT